MSKRVDAHIERLIRHAHELGSCYAAPWRQREALDRRVRRGALISPVRGLYADPDYWMRLDEANRAVHIMRGHLAKHPAWTFCSFSAAAAYGIDVPVELLGKTHIAMPPHSPGKSTSEAIRHGVANGAASHIRGIPVVDIEETLMQCLCDATFELGLAIVDSALHRGLVHSSDLVRFFQIEGKGRRGIRQARETLRWADAKSENGGESRVRAIMIEEGFAAPRLQVEFPNPLQPESPFRVDYWWRRKDGSQVAGELDGKAKYLDPEMLDGKSTVEAFSQERQREALLTAHGLRVVRFSFAQAQNRPYFARLLQAYGVPMR